MCHWCSYHILTSPVIYCWTDAQKNGIYLFYLKILQHDPKAGFCPLWRRRKKPIWRNLLAIQDEAISLVTMRSKELWLVEENHATRKQNWIAKYTNLEENAGKIKSVFVIRAALWAEKLFFSFFYYCYYYNTYKTYIHLLTLTVTYFQFRSFLTGFFFLLKTKKKKQLRNYCFY